MLNYTYFYQTNRTNHVLTYYIQQLQSLVSYKEGNSDDLYTVRIDECIINLTHFLQCLLGKCDILGCLAEYYWMPIFNTLC